MSCLTEFTKYKNLHLILAVAKENHKELRNFLQTLKNVKYFLTFDGK